jgi:hypothetical protein
MATSRHIPGLPASAANVPDPPSAATPGSSLPLWLWALALLALPVHDVALPGLRGIQPAEIAAVPLLVYAAFAWVRGSRPRPSVVDFGVAAWVAGLLIAAALSLPSRGADPAMLREVIVTLYLAALYGAVRVTSSGVTLPRFPLLFGLAAGIAALLGLVGFGLSVAGIGSPLASSSTSLFPYLGSAARALALTTTANMLASILMLGTLLVLFAWEGPRWLRLVLGPVLVLGLAVTLSKTILSFGAGLAVATCVLRRRNPRRSRLPLIAAVAAVAALASAHVTLTHFLVVPASSDRAILEEDMLIAGDPVGSFSLGAERYEVLRTNYFFSKRTGLVAVQRTWPVGLGPGGQPAFVDELMQEGLHPDNLWHAAPHSTYLGAAAEAGLAGLLGLLGFLAAMVVATRRILASASLPRGLAAAAAGALVALLIEAVSTDVMNFRHYWWLAAVLAGWSAAAGYGATREGRPKPTRAGAGIPRRPRDSVDG